MIPAHTVRDSLSIQFLLNTVNQFESPKDHPFFVALEKGNEDFLVDLSNHLDLSSFDFNQWMKKLPSLVEFLVSSRCSLAARYQAVTVLRKVTFQVFKDQPALLNDHACIFLKKAIDQFKQKEPALAFECLTILGLLEEGTKDLQACFKRICETSHQEKLCVESELPIAARKVRDAAKIIFELKDALHPTMQKKSDSFLQYWEKDCQQLQENARTREMKEKKELQDLFNQNPCTMKSKDLLTKGLTIFRAQQQAFYMQSLSANKLEKLDTIFMPYIESLKATSEQIEEALNQISQALAVPNKRAPLNVLETIPASALGKRLGPSLDDRESSKRNKTQQDGNPLNSLVNVHQPLQIDNGNKVLISSPVQQMTSRRALHLEHIQTNKATAQTYQILGDSLPLGGTIWLLDKKTLMTKKQFYLKAIALDPIDGSSYLKLGMTLTTNESVQLLNKTEMTQHQLFVKAVELDPRLALAYYNVAMTLPIKWFANEIRTEMPLDDLTQRYQDALLHAIDCSSTFAMAYFKLAMCVPLRGSIKLLNGRQLTSQDLLKKTIQYNPQFAHAYFMLGCMLSPEQPLVQLGESKMMTKRALYLETIRYSPSHAEAYHELGCLLQTSTEKVQLPNKTLMTKQELFIKAIECNPKIGKFYFNLADTLNNHEQSIFMRVLSDKLSMPMTKQNLYIKAIEYNCHLVEAYHELGKLLPLGGSIMLLIEGKQVNMTKQQLLDFKGNIVPVNIVR